jgi:hypothetical protein
MAQEPLLRPIIPFLEGTDVFVSNDKNVRFEAAIYPHLVGYQNFSDLVNARVKQSAKQFFWVITGTPAVRLRMFQSESAPVRTPSYMPRGSVQLIYSVDYRCAAAGQESTSQSGAPVCRPPSPGNKPTVSLWEFHGIVGHHSNGQDGCLYDEQRRPATGGRCQPSFEIANLPGTVNRKDGSFSTNYVRGGFNYRKNYLDRAVDGVATADREWTVRAEYQRQFHTDPDQRPFYSMNRASAGLSAAQGQSVRFCKARLEEAGGATILIDKPFTATDRASLWGQISCFPQIKGGWGIFVRGYRGQDTYNLGFLDNIRSFQVGVTFNNDGFFRFRPPQ